ncbi:MAG: hypothetical protein IT215_09215 [Chitinophagaceae bacterium]|nr:hypothetical protein [Chitinophagaceae bacterium]
MKLFNVSSKKFVKFKFILFPVLLISYCCNFLSCDECELDPDLVPNIITDIGATIAVKEEFEWDYAIESVKDNTAGCKTISAAASIAGIIIDYFKNQNDDESDEVFNKEQTIGLLEAGKKEEHNFHYTYINDGFYPMKITANKTGAVTERNVDNNSTSINLEIRKSHEDIFINASQALKEKIEEATVIVIVGDMGIDKSVTNYKGKPIYHVK